MADFEIAFKIILNNEKGIANHPNDAGKITKYGISLRFLKALPSESLKKYEIYSEPDEYTIRNLSIEQAKNIYHDEFWCVAPFERIDNQAQANYIFDMAISMGVAPAIKCAQRAIWAVTKRRGLIDDGILGSGTIIGLRMCGYQLMPAMRSERAGVYRMITKDVPTDEVFLQGWLNRAYECDE